MDEDPNRIALQLLFIFIMVLVNAFFAAAEIALVSVRRTRIKQLVEEGNLRAQTVLNLLDRPTNFMATVQIGVTLVGFLASAYAAVNIAGVPASLLRAAGMAPASAQAVAVLLVTIVIGFFTLVVGEIAPKSLGLQHAEWVALHFAGPIHLLSVVAKPAVRIVSVASDLVVRPFGGHVRFSAPILTEEELKMLVEAGEEEGVLEQDEKAMIHSIFDFTDTVARQVMTPRTDMDAAPVTASLDELLDVMTSTGHSRIPIYEDNIDSVIGVVHAKDLIPILRQDKQLFDMRAVMREAYFIPETKDVGELLAEFKRGNVQMAIVRDEYGGTAGLVTVEDVLEEIVGEIRDEYDIEEPLISIIDADHAIVNARMSIDDLNEEMALDIPETEDYETIGGFVFDLIGHQPEEGETVNYENIELKVEKVESGRLHSIYISRAHPEPETQGEHGNGGNGKNKKS